LAKAEALDTTITFTDLSSEKQANSRVVCYALSHLLNKAPLQVLMSCSDNDGYEAWGAFPARLRTFDGLAARRHA
jgi:hypothetical protein